MGFENEINKNLVERTSGNNEMVADNVLLGKDLLISLLDIVEKNPFSRFVPENLENYRK